MLKDGAKMKVIEENLVPQIEKALLETLGEVPLLRVRSIESPLGGKPTGTGLTLSIKGKGFERTIVVETKTNGQPRFAREAANALARYSQLIPKAYPVFAAPYISEKAAEVCEADGIGYIDLAGNCLLKFDGIYIERTGSPNHFSEKRELKSLFSPKATRVLRVLLDLPSRAWKLQDLAREAQVSLGQTSNVKRLLSTREWIGEGKEGLTLVEPERLLMEWARSYSYRKNNPRDFFSLLDISNLEASLTETCKKKGWRYALTGFSAAARLAPAVRYSRAMAYFEGDIQALSALLNLKEVPSGPNLTVLAPYDEGVFYGLTELGGYCLASAAQVYLDLAGFRGRGEEAAEAILREVLKPKW